MKSFLKTTLQKLQDFGINDEFGQSGKLDELMDFYGITSKDIMKAVIS